MSLLSNCTSGGCGVKIGPAELSRFLKNLPRISDPRLLVGFESSDDAAVWWLSEDQALVSTVDFFPPMVEDPHLFGRIAAANALSDVYAMGGRPILALNLVCFPEKMDPVILGEILAGGAEKVQEAGAVISGGHSIYDHEPKYGLAVTGLVRPDRILTNNGSAAGDGLILTKSLGVGLVMGANRVGLASSEQYCAATVSMERLNRYAAEKLGGFEVHAVTDVTGFGLLGHLVEMAGRSWAVNVNFDSLPLLPGALDFAGDYLFTAAAQRNRNQLSGQADISGLSLSKQEIIFDPQTSGGLLISLPLAQAEELLKAIRVDDPQASLIGQVLVRRKGEPAVIVL
ncbi:MAG: selenide, water dikinase SelD [Candidatus Adiutrix intracellularis]|nr:selenide, water dikinase SelD [Candidatus Adiutrix intracellularis]